MEEKKGQKEMDHLGNDDPFEKSSFWLECPVSVYNKFNLWNSMFLVFLVKMVLFKSVKEDENLNWCKNSLVGIQIRRRIEKI